MDVQQLSVTAELIRSLSYDEDNSTDTKCKGTLETAAWVQQLISSTPGSRVVFSAHGEGQSMQHLSTGLAGDHLFLSLLQNDLIRDMVVIYAEKALYTVLQLGVPVCGHPTIVHGGLISAVFDETFGVLLYAEGRYGTLELSMVFTARLEVDYKKPLPAESMVICTAEIESIEGRKIWVTAKLTDPSRETVYAISKALFVKPKNVDTQQADGAHQAAAATANGSGHVVQCHY